MSTLREACESRDESLPCSGLIQTLPATSSLDASGKDLMYSFSLASSSTDAYGKAALNMPVALMYPSLDRLCSFVSAKIFHSFQAPFRTIKKYASGYFLFGPLMKIPLELRSLGSGTRRCA